MVKGYWIASVDVNDPENYKAYIKANAVPFKKYGARFLVRGGEGERPEGKLRGRIVVIEFPDYQTAVDCYHSQEYKDALALRLPYSTGDIAIVQGYDGPQPGDG